MKKAIHFSDDLPNCAQSPSDVLSHSTTDDAGPSNALVRHSNLAAGHRLRGCARRGRGSLCLVLLRLFRLHVGTSLFHRHAPGVLPQITKAPTPLRLPPLISRIVDSRLYPPVLNVQSTTRKILKESARPFDTVHPVFTTKIIRRISNRMPG